MRDVCKNRVTWAAAIATGLIVATTPATWAGATKQTAFENLTRQVARAFGRDQQVKVETGERRLQVAVTESGSKRPCLKFSSSAEGDSSGTEMLTLNVASGIVPKFEPVHVTAIHAESLEALAGRSGNSAEGIFSGGSAKQRTSKTTVFTSLDILKRGGGAAARVIKVLENHATRPAMRKALRRESYGKKSPGRM